MEDAIEERYTRWKSSVPLLYDWFTNHNLTWPSLSCRWGPSVEQGSSRNLQQLYFSEQTYGQYPNTLVVVNCEIIKPRYAAHESLSQFNEEARSPYIKRLKTVIHPGEVNRIRDLPQLSSKVVATHTDKPEVYVWNLESQPNRSPAPGASPSKPDMVLTGHTANAEYALALCSCEPFVLSGGQDRKVLLWDINDAVSGLNTPGRPTMNSGGTGMISSTHVSATGIFKGHSKTVEDVQFRPSSANEFCSVGDDRCIIFWDKRQGNSPAQKITDAHDDDIHCLDWNAHQEHYILTGSADTSVKLFDLRKLDSNESGCQVKKFKTHESAVLGVQWCPAKASAFASAAADSTVSISDIEISFKSSDSNANHSEGLIFKHIGHRGQIVDFHWDPLEPWLLATVSTDAKGGGTLQLWRLSDLIYRPEDEVLAELESLTNKSTI
ncbi:WD-40 repeat-containing protein MSI4 [Selaginella moellendorffii]|uniref:WD-40 repeat-containing protein MSI4 n=1 Tax=Selaginella moellendorffii TaxID=88036 RepID=UPI000D1C984F|nr:WD-40 repeat-containing protein MSI4 [Selaginella moellendorffii]XP_024542493.1 WD-40 repeat-containing protein MSI4 [Selaginella moellendorffii]|eukprot:XP_024542492.1 WD-40 repeat-containing protein MSI4 [Selaginella moellendorffii]